MIKFEKNNDGYIDCKIIGSMTAAELVSELKTYYSDDVDAAASHLWDVRGITLTDGHMALDSMSLIIGEIKDANRTPIRVAYLADSLSNASICNWYISKVNHKSMTQKIFYDEVEAVSWLVSG